MWNRVNCCLGWRIYTVYVEVGEDKDFPCWKYKNLPFLSIIHGEQL